MKIENFQKINSITLKSNTISVEKKNDKESFGVNDSRNNAKLKKACQDFEAVFLTQILTKMREASPKSDLMGSSQEENTYQEMLDEQYANQIAHTSGVGLGDTLYKQLIKQI